MALTATCEHCGHTCKLNPWAVEKPAFPCNKCFRTMGNPHYDISNAPTIEMPPVRLTPQPPPVAERQKTVRELLRQRREEKRRARGTGWDRFWNSRPMRALDTLNSDSNWMRQGECEAGGYHLVKVGSEWGSGVYRRCYCDGSVCGTIPRR